MERPEHVARRFRNLGVGGIGNDRREDAVDVEEERGARRLPCETCQRVHGRTVVGVRLLVIGLVAGFLGALFGVGGGIVIVPALTLLCGFAARRAAATSLMAVLATAIAGTITYAFRGAVDVRAAALVGLPAVLGVVVGTAVQQRIPVRHLSYAFALLVAAVGVRLLV